MFVDSLLPRSADDSSTIEEQREELLHLLTMALRLLQARHHRRMTPLSACACNLATDRLAGHPAASTARAVLAQPLDLLARRDPQPGAPDRQPGRFRQGRPASLIATLEQNCAGRSRPSANSSCPMLYARPRAWAQAGAPPRRSPATPAGPGTLCPWRQHRDGSAEALQQRFNEARWLVRSLQQRQTRCYA